MTECVTGHVVLAVYKSKLNECNRYAWNVLCHKLVKIVRSPTVLGDLTMQEPYTLYLAECVVMWTAFACGA